MDIREWLAGLGLGQYADAFIQNDIDLETLGMLTGDDLKEMGVASIGHRLRILRDAAALAPSDEPAEPTPAQPMIERRNLTVMFCDLVGSTQLSVDVDPEDLRDHMADFRQVIVDAIEPYSGYVAQYLGDGVLIYFGYPRAFEYDAENAVSAALDIVSSVSAMDPFGTYQPQVRIGIATGLTVVGRSAVLEDEIGESAVGRTLNLAARLQALAEPDGVVISGSTRRLVGDLYVCTDLGEQRLKGFGLPVQVWQVEGRANLSDRFHALRATRQLSPLTGRHLQADLLADRYADARLGLGRFVIIVGDGGVGKSRLARHVVDHAGQTADAGAILQCAPNSAGSSFHPFRYYLIRACGITGDDDARTATEKIAKVISFAGPITETRIALVAELIRLDNIDLSPLGLLSAQERRRQLMGFLRALTLMIARSTSVLILEDIQWADPSTMELFTELRPVFQTMPLLILATSRPVEDAPWIGAEDIEVLELGRLDDTASVDLINKVADGHAIPENAVRKIVERSDGVPMFIEELTLGYLEAETDDADHSENSVGVPVSLADALMARLDRLKNGRHVAQVAAVIGYAFPTAILIDAVGTEAAHARLGIDELLAAKILETGESQFGETVSFRHNLLRDAAYDLLLRKDRERLHCRVADCLIDNFPAIANSVPHIVALQLEQGQKLDEAAAHWDQAGEQASKRSAYAEAATFFQRALDVIARIEPSPSRDERELTYRLNLTSCLVAGRGYADPAAEAAMEKAVALSHAAGRRDKLIPALTAKWVTVGTHDHTIRTKLAEQVFEAARGGNDVDALFAHRVMATTKLFGGEFTESLAHIGRFFDIYDRETHEPALAVVGPSNHAITMMFGLAEIYTIRNELDLADQWTARVFETADALGAIHNVCHSIAFIGCFLPTLRAQDDVLAHQAARLDFLSAEHDLPFWRGHADLFCGLSQIRSGQVEAGFELARKGIRGLIESNAFSICWFLLYADACEKFGRLDEAARILTMVRPAQERGELWMVAEFHRIEALVAIGRGEAPDIAHQKMQMALEVAREQGADLFLQRAQADMPKLDVLVPA